MSGLKRLSIGFAVFCAITALPAAAREAVLERGVPHYLVAPFWPKALPNNWIMSQVGGVAVDRQDHIWVLQRPKTADAKELGADATPRRSLCCKLTPSVLEFDAAGNLLRSWGGQDYVADWPKNEHAIYVDRSGNVWISGNANTDRQVLKFTSDGKQLLEIGHPSSAARNNQDTSILGRPAGIWVDDAAHEVYISDGYLNNRVVVYDSETGAFRRGWGAYGVPLDQISNDDPAPRESGGAEPKRFYTSHCVKLSEDGLVYVCDRNNDRVQVFTKQGRFLKEFDVHPTTLGSGSAYSLAFSHDKGQKYLLVADGGNDTVWIIRRSDGVEVGHFGSQGRNAGQFHELHQIAIDSRGTVYTGETDNGKRVQKFILGK